VIKLEKINVLLDEQNEKFKLAKNEMFKNPASRVLRETKEFQSLSEEKKKDLIFIHRNLREADARLGTNAQMKLTKFLYNKDVTEFVDGKGEYIYNLPKDRMSTHEASSSFGETVGRFVSGVKESWRPAADIDEASYIDNPGSDSVNGSLSDIKDGEYFSIHVFHRASLGQACLLSFNTYVISYKSRNNFKVFSKQDD
jgi:hypothetical protein